MDTKTISILAATVACAFVAIPAGADKPGGDRPDRCNPERQYCFPTGGRVVPVMTAVPADR